MILRRVNGGVAAVAVVAALAFASPAHAVRGWHPPIPIGTGVQPKIAVNADGTAAMAWTGNDSIQAAVRNSGAWSAPENLGGEGWGHDVAIDGSGNVAVAWVGPDRRIHAAVKPAGGAWLPHQAISGAGASEWPWWAADVAFAGDGSVTAIWDRPLGYSEHRIETSVRPASSGQWDPPTELGRGLNPDIAVQPGGSAVAVWGPDLPYEQPGVKAAVRGSDGVWEPAAILSDPAYSFSVYPRVAVDGAGNATALWSRMRQGGVMALESATRPFGSAGWLSPDTVATGRVYGYTLGITDVGLAVSPAGNLVTDWKQWDGNSWVRAASRVPGEPWQTQDLSQRSFQDLYPAVAADSVGNALALWSRSASSAYNGFIEVSLRDVATGIWTAPMSISGSGGIGPDVAFDGSGNAVAVWSRGGLVEAAEFAEGGVPPPPGPPPGPGPPPPDPPPFCEPGCPGPPPPPPPARTCRVPRVVGKRQFIAQAAIKRAHCSTGRVRKVRARRPRGRVLGQNPRAGRVVPRNTWVKLTVSRGR